MATIDKYYPQIKRRLEYDTESVLSCIDEEDWARDEVWDEDVFCESSFKQKLGETMTQSEWQTTLSVRQQMAVTLKKMLRLNATLVKAQLTFNVKKGEPLLREKSLDEYHHDIIRTYGRPLGFNSSKVLAKIAGLWKEIQGLNFSLKKPFYFFFTRTKPGEEMYILNGELVTRKNTCD